MTTFLSTFAPLTSNATWQALMGAIDSHIISFGWVLSSDTGQTDPGAASIPATNGTSGYRVYTTGDALTPIYMRIDYYRGSANQPRLKVQAGYSTDGAGTITGQKCTQLDFNPNDPNVTRQLAMAGNTSWLTITWGIDSSTFNQIFGFNIERELDTTGAEVATGFNIGGCQGTSSACQQYVPSSGTIPPQISPPQFLLPATGSNSSAVIGANTLVGPLIPIKETGGGNPQRGSFVYLGSDFAFNTTTVVNIYGTNHTYLCTPCEFAWTGVGSFATKLAFRYE